MYGRIGGSVLRKPLPAWSEVGRRRRARRHTPCVPIRPLSDGESFMRKVKRFLSSDIMHIASNPQEYSDFVRRKPSGLQLSVEAIPVLTMIRISPRDFSAIRLGDETVGLLGAGGSVRIKGDHFRQQFWRNDITSVVDLRVTHPLVENAGDILLEHELRMDGDHPLVLSRPGVGGMEPRLAEMGFVHVGRNNWVLDPQQDTKVWTKNVNDQRHRVDRPRKYLSKVEDSDSQESCETDSSDDDPSYYLERAVRRLAVGQDDSE